MLEAKYVLFHPKKKKFVALNSLNQAVFVFDPQKAKTFTHTAAKNFMKNNATGEFKNCRIDPASEETRQQMLAVVNASIARNEQFQSIIDDLAIKVNDYELQMIDLYHFTGNNPKLPAHKGYKVYKKLAEIVQNRAKAKAQIKAIESAMNFEYTPYNPRTELYGELDNMK